MVFALFNSLFHSFNFYSVAPQISPFFFEDLANSGDTVSIQCTITKGDMPLNITWTLNNKTIGDDYGITVMKLKRFSTLNIDSVQAEHAGLFTCIASNRAGETSYSAVLNVNGNYV